MKTKVMLEKDLCSSDVVKITGAMLYIANNCNDLDWAENVMMRMSNNGDKNVSGLALTCLGHLARINGTINKRKIIPFLRDIIDRDIEDLSGRAEDALDDINMFVN